MDTAFLRVATEESDASNGHPVLLISRGGRVVVHPDACPPVTVIDEEELDR